MRTTAGLGAGAKSCKQSPALQIQELVSRDPGGTPGAFSTACLHFSTLSATYHHPQCYAMYAT